ncbi:MAG: [FeFe] hydrogenase H-cluster radical SAM maturase HydG [Victivallales bacterium]|nr:[FeFe] hydrogenase H-cluster radical SAM maturase HydG [Victivallales bacterium]MCF7888843.1 [FeFe] hydrogenase H-cluster radical SAM maturase HydG [Victivallales bacterium]
MKTYKDRSSVCEDFINDDYITDLINDTGEDKYKVRDIITKSMAKKPLSVKETAMLLSAESPELVEEIFEAARELKRSVYGNRIVIFAPLYIGNYCTNDCKYCGFRKSLRTTVRKTLSQEEIISEVRALEDSGHKRLILVFGEHPKYSPEFIADTVKKVYSVKHGNGEIRRVNINAAPLDTNDYKTVKEAGIGTYQIFQETYHHGTYKKVHPENTCKNDYLYRLDGLSRAFEAGCDDVGIGALFGLYDWKFEVLAMVQHSLFLQEKFGVGPHTISFPRIKSVHNTLIDEKYFVNDYDFKRLVAILRLAVPYTGMILTARENPDIRRELLGFGVSQIDAGSRIELGGYSNTKLDERKLKEQFSLGDMRPIDEIIYELIDNGYLPSFCTACYRLGRTGERFMEFAIPGFIEKYCTPNALLTLKEYLMDYASPATINLGDALINRELSKFSDEKIKNELVSRLEKIENKGKRDLYF